MPAQFAVSLVIGIVTAACAIIGGFATAYANILSWRLAQLGLSASQVICLRYLLAMLVYWLMYFLTQPVGDSFNLISNHFFAFATTAIFLVIVPLYFLQKGIELIQPVYTGIFMAFVPVISFFIQVYISPKSFNWPEASLQILLAVALILTAYIRSLSRFNR